MDEVLVKFLEIYNYVYPYRTQIDVDAYQTVQSVLDDETLVNTDEDNLGFSQKLMTISLLVNLP